MWLLSKTIVGIIPTMLYPILQVQTNTHGSGPKSKAQGRKFQILGNEHPVFRYPNFDYGDMQDVNRKKKRAH